MNYREYQRLKADAEAEYRRKIEAIETVWKLSGGAATVPSANGAKSNENGISKGSLQEAVRHAYKLLSGEFTHRDVYNQIIASDPIFAAKIKDKMPSLSGTLKRLADDQELVLVEAGKGKRASKYRRPG
jgi:hypothetical protein